MTNKVASCLVCHERKIFIQIVGDAYKCSECGSQRSLSLDAVDANLDGREGKFWAAVKKTPFCWPWILPCNSPKGPKFRFRGADVKVGRMAFFFTHGSWPRGGAFRVCANQFCCRPSHIVDMEQKLINRYLKKSGRHRNGVRPLLKKCKRGHEMSGENLGVTEIQRFCRTCHNWRRRKYYKAIKRNKNES